MASRYAVDDSGWEEVMIMNGYAVFLGYLMMGVRGLGVLVVTWTTVVLLGGFVSDLENKDFWCLTGITLVQTAGVFNFLLKEKLSDMLRSWWGLLFSVIVPVLDTEFKRRISKRRIILAVISLVIQVLVLVIILCPLGVLYTLGLYISTGVSLWRLIQHDYGDAGGTNQKPALQLLYCLAVAQGMLFGYKTIHAFGARKRLAKFVAKFGNVDEELVAVYLEETVAGCEKDPSFATGRNLVTYAVDLMMEARSDEGFISGIRFLGGIISQDYACDPKVLAKLLLTRSDSWSHMLQRLLEAVGPRSPYSREVREHAARILALVARAIRLQQVPGVIECVSSVLELASAEECDDVHGSSNLDWIRQNYGDSKLGSYERVELLDDHELDYLVYSRSSPGSPSDSSFSNWLAQCLGLRRKQKEIIQRKNTVHGFDGLLKESVNIIHKLAIDKGNRRIMSRDTVLQHRITMAPLKLHRDNHDTCSEPQDSDLLVVLEKCWVLTEWLMVMDTAAVRLRETTEDEAAEGEGLLMPEAGAGPAALENAILNSVKNTVKSIFDCLDCPATQKKQAVQILLHLNLDMSFIMDCESRKRRLTWILLLISLSDYDDSRCWMVSGFIDRKHKMLTFYGIKKLADEKLRAISNVLLAFGDISNAITGRDEDISVRTHAAIIMLGLCVCYSDSPSTDIPKEVKDILVGMIPEVVEEILIRCASTREESQAQPADDVEKGVVSKDGDAVNERRLQKALVSLCRDGYMGSVHLKSEFNEKASEKCKEQGKSLEDFMSLLFE